MARSFATDPTTPDSADSVPRGGVLYVGVEPTVLDEAALASVGLRSGILMHRFVDALNAPLDDFSAIVVDVTVIGDPLSSALDKLVCRAPHAAVLVLCSPHDRRSVNAILRAYPVEWLPRPLDVEQLSLRLNRFEQQTRLRREVENSLRFIQRVADATPEMLYLFDVSYAESLYVNRRTCAVLGCTPEGIVPEGWAYFRSVMHPEDIDRTCRYLETRFQTIAGKDVVQTEYRIRNRHNHWRWIHTREVAFQRDERGRVVQVLGTAQDVTARRELDETRALLAAIVDSSDDAIVGKTLNGEILSWNAAATRLYGYSAEQMIGDNIARLEPAENKGDVAEILDRIRRGERVEHHRTLRQCRDGRQIEVAVTVSPIISRDGKAIGASSIARPVGS